MSVPPFLIPLVSFAEMEKAQTRPLIFPASPSMIGNPNFRTAPAPAPVIVAPPPDSNLGGGGVVPMPDSLHARFARGETGADEFESHLTALEYDLLQTIHQFRSPYLKFADMLVAAIGPGTDRSDIIYTPQPTIGLDQDDDADDDESDDERAKETEQVKNQKKKEEEEGVRLRQRSRLGRKLLKLFEKLAYHDLSAATHGPGSFEFMQTVNRLARLTHTMLMRSTPPPTTKTTTLTTEFKTEAAMIAGQMLIGRSFEAHTHVKTLPRLSDPDRVFTYTSIFKPAIAGAIQLAAGDINIVREGEGRMPLSEDLLMCSPGVSVHFARFVAFCYNGNTPQNPASLARHLGTHSHGTMQVDMHVGANRTRFQIMESNGLRAGYLAFFIHVEYDARTGMLVPAFAGRQSQQQAPMQTVVRRGRFAARDAKTVALL